MLTAEVTDLIYGLLVVDRVDNANHICLQNRPTQTAIRILPELSTSLSVTEMHHAPTDLGDLLKQLLICLLSLCWRKTSILQLKLGNVLSQFTSQQNPPICLLFILQNRLAQLNAVKLKHHWMKRFHNLSKSKNKLLKYLNSPQCVWELSLEWHLQVWWFPLLDRAPRTDTKQASIKQTNVKTVSTQPDIYQGSHGEALLRLVIVSIPLLGTPRWPGTWWERSSPPWLWRQGEARGV